MNNIISAIKNLVENPKIELIRKGSRHNRANNMGEALEEYIKDLFTNTVVYGEDYCASREVYFMCIINADKFGTFENTSEMYELAKKNKKLEIQDVHIKNPNNPTQLKEAKLVTFYKEVA